MRKWWLVIALESTRMGVRPREVMVTTRAKQQGRYWEGRGCEVVAYGPFRTPDDAQDHYRLTRESRMEAKHSGNIIGGNPRRRTTLMEEAAPFGLTPEGHVRLRKLTLAKAREEVRRFGYSLKKKTETGEYVLTPLMEREGNASYYTDDLSDAIATARDMSERRWRETRERGMGGGY